MNDKPDPRPRSGETNGGARLERLVRVLRAVHDANRLLARETDRERLLWSFCKVLVDTRGYELAWIGFADPVTKEVRAAAWAPPEGEGYVRSIRVTCDSSPTGRGPTGTAIQTGRPDVLRDIPGDPRFAPWRERAAMFGYRSSLAVPVTVRGRAVGAVSVYASELDAFDDEEVALLAQLAGDLGLALSFFEEQAEHAGTMRRLARASDYAWHMFENVPALILGVRRNGTVELFNRACEELTGYAREEVTGRPVAGTLFSEAAWEKLRSDAEVTKPRELPFRTKAGAERIVEWRVGVLPTPVEGEPLLLCMGVDVTERKRLEEHLTQAEKLSALGELIAGVAHELNNPLTGVIGFSQILSERSDCPDDVKRDLLAIRKNAQRCKAVVENLLRFARQHKPERRTIHVRDVLESTLELLAYQFRVAGVEVVRDYAPDVPPVSADSNELQQVFVNILTNAMQAIRKASKGGRVTVRTAVPGGKVRIEFEDDGPGIAPEHLSKVFDPFFTTKPPGEGTGLGLSVCFGIVTAHKGRIWAESEYGKGAKFIVELPPAEGVEARAKPSVTTTQLIRLRQRVLVVDDEDVVIDVLERILESLGFKVTSTRSAEQALTFLQDNPVDFILCDLRMPGMGGPGLYDAVLARDPALAKRIIFCTGDTVSQDAREFVRRTRCRVVAKPFNMSQLAQTLAELQQEMIRETGERAR